jgi:hypothetical protein
MLGTGFQQITASGFSKRDTQNYAHVHMYTRKSAMEPVWGSYWDMHVSDIIIIHMYMDYGESTCILYYSYTAVIARVRGRSPRTRAVYITINPWQPCYNYYTWHCISHLIGLVAIARVCRKVKLLLNLLSKLPGCLLLAESWSTGWFN